MTEQELLQVPKELRETFRILDEQGWTPICMIPPYPTMIIVCRAVRCAWHLQRAARGLL